MPVLSNPQREQFATLVSQGTPTKRAYELAGYKPSKGNPYHLASEPEVKERIAELEARDRKRVGQTVERLVAELDDMFEAAKKLGSPSAGVSAVMGKARLLGLVVDRSEVEATLRKPLRAPGANTNGPMTLDQWREIFQPKTTPPPEQAAS